jgi:hypothetical protein
MSSLMGFAPHPQRLHMKQKAWLTLIETRMQDSLYWSLGAYGDLQTGKYWSVVCCAACFSIHCRRMSARELVRRGGMLENWWSGVSSLGSWYLKREISCYRPHGNYPIRLRVLIFCDLDGCCRLLAVERVLEVMSVEAVPRPRIIQGMWARMDASCNGRKTVRLPSSQWLAA